MTAPEPRLLRQHDRAFGVAAGLKTRRSFERVVLVVLAAASAQVFGAALARAQGPAAPDATTVLAAAREALGGETRLAAVKTFVATGRTRQIRGNNLVPIEFEINCELPDRFVRKDEIPAQDTDPTTLGFNGDQLIQFPPVLAARGRADGPPPSGSGRDGGTPTTPIPDRAGGPGQSPPSGRAGGPAPPPVSGGPPLSPAQQRVATVKQDFVRLTLGMLASSFSSYPLTFAYVGQAEAPEGKADVLDVKGGAGFSARFFVHGDTHLPIMVTWQVPTTNVIVRVPGQPAPAGPPGAIVVDAPPPPPETASQEERTTYAQSVADLRRQTLAQAKPTEYRVYYADYRDVGGLKLPFRIRRAIAGETIEETTFDRFRINAKIDPRKFEVQR